MLCCIVYRQKVVLSIGTVSDALILRWLEESAIVIASGNCICYNGERIELKESSNEDRPLNRNYYNLELMDYFGTYHAKDGKKDGISYSVCRGEVVDVPVLDIDKTQRIMHN